MPTDSHYTIANVSKQYTADLFDEYYDLESAIIKHLGGRFALAVLQNRYVEVSLELTLRGAL